MSEETPPSSAIIEALSLALGGIGMSPRIHERASAILATLGFALFTRSGSGTLRLSSHPPEWLSRLWPPVIALGDWLPISIVSPFLENFLIDAKECWTKGGSCRVQSGPWVEGLQDDEELHLEATAFTDGGQAMLVIERLGVAFDRRSDFLQKGREAAIAYQRLNSEMQKKEILLHCIGFEMRAALGNVITSLRLIELEQEPTAMRRLLELASQATLEQQRLIDRVHVVFAAELEGLYGRGKSGSDPLDAARRAVEVVSSQFSGRGVRLNILPASGELKAADEGSQLERVMVCLLENALEHTPAGGHVAVRIEGESDVVTVHVEDDGPELSPELTAQLFSRYEPLGGLQTPAGRLHFCRITVENRQGEIGYQPRDGGGNCFWIRWPKVLSTT